MVFVPAVALGALVVFALGYILTEAVLRKNAKRRRGAPTLYRDTLKEVPRPGDLTEKEIDTFAKLGGGVAVVLLVLSLFIVPREWATVIWAVLTVIGIAFGLFTFLPEQSTAKPQTRPKYRSPGSTRAPPRQEDRCGQAPSTTAPPPPKEDPYRTLLAKTRYDQSLADRLIEYERRRMPYASLDDLCRSALARMEQDSRQSKQG